MGVVGGDVSTVMDKGNSSTTADGIESSSGRDRRMPRVLSGVGERGQPDESQSEIAVHLIVPEEFAGMSMGELHSRRVASARWT